MAKINETEIRKAIAVLHPDGELFEIRAIDGKWNASGYFTSADKLIEQLQYAKIRQKANIYITLNAIKDDCYSRQQHDVLMEYATPTTTDNDIDGYNWLMIDLDPKRASGVSSSDSELEAAKLKANAIFEYMANMGWNDPVIAVSGNGVHLLYKVSIVNEKEQVELFKKSLQVLNALFSDDQVDVDVKTFNPARICKLYGTEAKKGANTTGRPHRMSYLHKVPENVQSNDIALLRKLCGMIPDEPKPERYNNYNPKAFDLDSWISEHDIPVKKVETWAGGKKWVLEHCLFDESHKGKDAAIIQTNDGKICYNCFHNSCAENHWHEVRLLYEPYAYDSKTLVDVDRSIKPNHTTAIKKPDVTGEPLFYTTEQIRLMKRPAEEFLKSGITVIDRKMRGLKKGFVTCISGLRGCGKSSLISQIALNIIDRGFRVAMFSGELTAQNVQRWLTLQAAGKRNTREVMENFFSYSAETLEAVSKWANGKLYVYNNDYGNDYSLIEKSLEQCIMNEKVDLIILDNLMSMNISALDSDKYLRQSKFVERLETLAKQYNVHVIFVAHPRKSQGFLRLDDVSGSNDIVNRVDNAFIVHRVNQDFKRLSAEMFKWKSDNPIYNCTNVIEICKDRDGGVQDEFIPLWFERETKRLKNDPAENIIYGWDTGIPDEPPF